MSLGRNTYHHFTNGRKSDSELDGILHTGVPGTEQLTGLHCGLLEPLMESHHDAILSSFSLESVGTEVEENLIVAPKIPNERVKIVWTDENISKYKYNVEPTLMRLQEELSTSQQDQIFKSRKATTT